MKTMTMDKEALEFAAGMIGAAQSSEDVLRETNGRAISLPMTTKVEDIESFLPYRRRYRGVMRTTQIDQFAEYSNRAAGEVNASTEDADDVPCFVDPEKMTAKVFFNLGTRKEPGHGDHSAILNLPKTATFEELLSKNGQQLQQKELAEWLEDWAPQLKAIGEDGEALNLAATVAAVRRITIGAKSESTSEDRTFGGRQSSMSEIEAQNKDTLPAFIEFTCEPYHGLEERTFRLRVGLLTSEPPRLVLRMIRLEHHQEEMADEFRDHLIHALDGNLVETFVGSFNP